jgi:hypothetical protein
LNDPSKALKSGLRISTYRHQNDFGIRIFSGTDFFKNGKNGILRKILLVIKIGPHFNMEAENGIGRKIRILNLRSKNWVVTRV